MSIKSSGILLYRLGDEGLSVLLVHPGGPFWSGRIRGSWSIPKGLVKEDEMPLDAAKRELFEETGLTVEGSFMDLGEIGLPSRKLVYIWALSLDEHASLPDVRELSTNRFQMEWPRRSGIIREFPEVDEARWFEIKEAKEMIQKGQAGFLERLVEAVLKEPSDPNRPIL